MCVNNNNNKKKTLKQKLNFGLWSKKNLKFKMSKHIFFGLDHHLNTSCQKKKMYYVCVYENILETECPASMVRIV